MVFENLLQVKSLKRLKAKRRHERLEAESFCQFLAADKSCKADMKAKINKISKQVPKLFYLSILNYEKSIVDKSKKNQKLLYNKLYQR